LNWWVAQKEVVERELESISNACKVMRGIHDDATTSTRYLHYLAAFSNMNHKAKVNLKKSYATLNMTHLSI
jgi:hypothetical protein